MVRDRNVPLDDLLGDPTEPPIEDFESGFIGATDEELWRTVAHYRDEETRRNQAHALDDNMLVALDQISETNDTVKMLYDPRSGGKQVGKQMWRVDFLYIWGVVPYLPDEEEICMDPDMRDENGVLDMQKIWDAKGIPLPPTWRKK